MSLEIKIKPLYRFDWFDLNVWPISIYKNFHSCATRNITSICNNWIVKNELLKIIIISKALRIHLAADHASTIPVYFQSRRTFCDAVRTAFDIRHRLLLLRRRYASWYEAHVGRSAEYYKPSIRPPLGS